MSEPKLQGRLGTRKQTCASMAVWCPGTGAPPVCALGAALHDLVTGWHEPDESRGSRPDL